MSPAQGDAPRDGGARSYAEIMREQGAARERDDAAKQTDRQLRELQEEAASARRLGTGTAATSGAPAVPALVVAAPSAAAAFLEAASAGGGGAGGKRRGWGEGGLAAAEREATAAAAAAGGAPKGGSATASVAAAPQPESAWESDGGGAAAPKPATAKRSRWDSTPADTAVARGRSDATPSVSHGAASGSQAGGSTPGWGDDAASGGGAVAPKRPRSRWDETPAASLGGATPAPGTVGWAGGATPAGYGGATPAAGAAGAAAAAAAATAFADAVAGGVPLTPEQYAALRWEREVAERNRPLSDGDLDAMLPTEGYKILDQPPSYVPIRTPSRKLMATPGPSATPMYGVPSEDRSQRFDVPQLSIEGLPDMKPEDYQYFAPLLKESVEEELSLEEQKERKIMRLLLKIKNGTPPQRKTALRQVTEKAREFGAGPLFNQARSRDSLLFFLALF